MLWTGLGGGDGGGRGGREGAESFICKLAGRASRRLV